MYSQIYKAYCIKGTVVPTSLNMEYLGHHFHFWSPIWSNTKDNASKYTQEVDYRYPMFHVLWTWSTLATMGGELVSIQSKHFQNLTSSHQKLVVSPPFLIYFLLSSKMELRWLRLAIYHIGGSTLTPGLGSSIWDEDITWRNIRYKMMRSLIKYTMRFNLPLTYISVTLI